MAVKIPLHLFSHRRKIANHYKNWCRQIEGFYSNRETVRYKITLLRCEFDAIYYERDMRKSKQMLLEKEMELEKKFFLKPPPFPTSPEGADYNRYPVYEDWCLDYWHPFEKAAYPDYFARRELRKQQYLEMWDRLHGPPKP